MSASIAPIGEIGVGEIGVRFQLNPLVEGGHVKATASAFSGARELGLNDLSGMCAIIMALTCANFFKSMTTHADHRIWQDVYHFKTGGGDEVYLKLTVIDDVSIVSFKEL